MNVTTPDDDPLVDTRMTAEMAAPRVLIAAAVEFCASLDELMTQDTPDGPHKSRVALRRLLAALVAFKPIMRRKLAHRLRCRLQHYFRIIGRVRDADVVAQDMSLGADNLVLLAKADKLRRKVRKALTNRRADRVAGRLRKAFGGKKWQRRNRSAQNLRHTPIKSLATSALDGCWNECLAHGKDLTRLTATRRHDLRKKLKTLRYLTEHFGSLWPSGQAASFLTALPALQDELGTLNDIAMARAHGLTVADDTESATLQNAAAAWKDLAKCPKWWI